MSYKAAAAAAAVTPGVVLVVVRPHTYDRWTVLRTWFVGGLRVLLAQGIVPVNMCVHKHCRCRHADVALHL
jgi:hypothetical protein